MRLHAKIRSRLGRALSLLALILGACSAPPTPIPPTATPTLLPTMTATPVTPSPTRPVTQTPLVVPTLQAATLRSSATTLRVGQRVTITGTLPTGLSVPVYSVHVKDQGSNQLGLLVSITPSNEVKSSADASQVLKLVSAKAKTGEIVAVLEGRAKGLTEISVSAYGETGQVDKTGRQSFFFVTKVSKEISIKIE